MCQCCEDSNAKCGCPEMKRVQIRSTILLCIALIVDGCCLGMYMQPYSIVQCSDTDYTIPGGDGKTVDNDHYVFSTFYSATCILNNGRMQETLWMNDYQRNRCTSASNAANVLLGGTDNPCGNFKDAGDAYGFAVSLIGAAMFFNNFVALCAILELMKYTVGSKCQAAYVIVGGILTMCLALAAGAICFAPGMSTGNERDARDICGIVCNIESQLTGTKSGHIGPAPVGAVVGGIFAIGEIVIGILMCAQAQKDKEAVFPPEANKVTPL